MSANGNDSNVPLRLQISVGFDNSIGFWRLLDHIQSMAITLPEAKENEYIKARFGSQVKVRQSGIKKLAPRDIPIDVVIDFRSRTITTTDATDSPINYDEKLIVQKNLESVAYLLQAIAGRKDLQDRLS